MSLWYENEPQYTENTNCPICGKELSKCTKIVQLVGIGEFYKIFTCSEEHKKEFIRQVWKLSKQKDKRESK